MIYYSWNFAVKIVSYSEKFFILPTQEEKVGFSPAPVRECSPMLYDLYKLFSSQSKEFWATYSDIVDWSRSVNNGQVHKSLSGFLRHLCKIGILISQDKANEKPAPAAAPVTMAIVGIFNEEIK